MLPGGESTTTMLCIAREGLAEPLRQIAGTGTPLLATCAELSLLDRAHLGVLDYRARRNAFGRQIRSFEADLELPGVDGEPMRAVFIRAPWIEGAGEDVIGSPRWTGTPSPHARAPPSWWRSAPSSPGTTACTGNS